MWLMSLIKELKIGSVGSMRLYCDNKATNNIAHNQVQRDSTKHTEINQHFINKMLDNGLFVYHLSQ